MPSPYKLVLAVCLLSPAALLHAQTPAGSTGQCKDGTYSTSSSKNGACQGHKGVKAWFAASTTQSKPASTGATTKTPLNSSASPTAAGASGQCNDGTYSTAAKKDGACRGHKGVKAWFSAPSNTSSSASPAHAAPVATAPNAVTTPAVPGGGKGQVWVNTDTKVYHCSGDRYYGKTKKGAYMSEADAKTKGFHPDAGKACR